MRLTYSASTRCSCGAGLAYPEKGDYPAGYKLPSTAFRWPYSGVWDCSAILLGTADQYVEHTAQLPFAFYEIKSENQPRAQGRTTRPQETPHG